MTHPKVTHYTNGKYSVCTQQIDACPHPLFHNETFTVLFTMITMLGICFCELWLMKDNDTFPDDWVIMVGIGSMIVIPLIMCMIYGFYPRKCGVHITMNCGDFTIGNDLYQYSLNTDRDTNHVTSKISEYSRWADERVRSDNDEQVRVNRLQRECCTHHNTVMGRVGDRR